MPRAKEYTNEPLSPDSFGKNLLRPLDISQLKFTFADCDLCGCREQQPRYQVSFLGQKFNFVRCRSCGLIFQNPRLDQASLNHIYESLEYWEHQSAVKDDPTMLNYYSYLGDRDLRHKNALLRLKWINRFLPAPAKILDLGCSDGMLVHTLAQSGYQASGLDISATMTASAKQTFGVQVDCADFEKPWPTSTEFDAITCFATISNFFLPSLVFENIQKNLRLGGHFFFNFGDGDRWFSRLLGSRLYLYRPTAGTIYSRKTLGAYCEKYGLRICEIANDRQIISLARLAGFFRLPFLLPWIKRIGLEKATIQIPWPTGYWVRAVRYK